MVRSWLPWRYSTRKRPMICERACLWVGCSASRATTRAGFWRELCVSRSRSCVYAYGMCVCTCTPSACIRSCMYVCMYVCAHVCMYTCMYVHMYVCTHVCMYTCMCVCTHVCIIVRIHVCTHVCVFVCMCVQSDTSAPSSHTPLHSGPAAPLHLLPSPPPPPPPPPPHPLNRTTISGKYTTTTNYTACDVRLCNNPQRLPF